MSEDGFTTDMIRRHLRTLAAVAAFGAVAFGLSACTTNEPSSCIPAASPGQTSNLVSAAGAFGSSPQVEFPAPLLAAEVQATTLIAGEGPLLQPADWVATNVTFLNGRTGAVIEASTYDGRPDFAFVLADTPIGSLAEGLSCQRAGSRVAVTIPAATAFPDGSRPAGLNDTDALVVVLDVARSALSRAHGTINASQSGFPSVVRAVDGRPGITWNGSEAPTDFRVSTLITGDDDRTVAEGDTVLVQYTGVVWNADAPFDSSWAGQGPVSLTASPEAVIPGFAKAIVGQKVGSQVVAVLPPAEAYGEQGTQTIPADSTLVFVVDILDIS